MLFASAFGTKGSCVLGTFASGTGKAFAVFSGGVAGNVTAGISGVVGLAGEAVTFGLVIFGIGGCLRALGSLGYFKVLGFGALGVAGKLGF